MNKNAIILDTNYIISKRNYMNGIVENSNDSFDIFIPEIVQKEFVMHEVNNTKKLLKEFDTNFIKYNKFVEYTKVMKDEDYVNAVKEKTENEIRGYKASSIPLNLHKIDLQKIIERALEKKAPFLIEQKSDQGFKDSLIFISILDYFESNKDSYEKIYFVTDDNGFHKVELKNEFKEKIGLDIEVLKVDQADIIFKNKINVDDKKRHDTTNIDIKVELFNTSHVNNNIRGRVKSVVESICGYEESFSGKIYFNSYFKLANKVSVDQIEGFFIDLEKTYTKIIFLESVDASAVFDFGIEIKCIDKIPVSNILNLYELYNCIVSEYTNLINSFYFAVTQILNMNYDKDFKFNYNCSINENILPF